MIKVFLTLNIFKIANKNKNGMDNHKLYRGKDGTS